MLILVVEDDVPIQTFLEMALTDEGYEVELAPNGRVALELIAVRRPDLILLDMWMPGMDGRTFLKHFHALPYATTPIVMLTANDDVTLDKLLLRSLSDCLIKPFDLNELLTCIHRHLPAQT